MKSITHTDKHGGQHTKHNAPRIFSIKLNFACALLAAALLFSCNAKNSAGGGESELFSPTTSLDYLGMDLGENPAAPYPYEYYKQTAHARMLADSGRYYEALSQYDAAQKTYGENPEILVAMGSIYSALGDSEAAKKLFAQAALAPKFEQSDLWSTVRYREAAIAFSAGDEKAFADNLAAVIQKQGLSDISIVSIARSRGLDDAVTLFALQPDYAYEAYRELGLYLSTRSLPAEEFSTSMQTDAGAASQANNQNGGQKNNQTKNQAKNKTTSQLKNGASTGFMYSLSALSMLVQWGLRDVLRANDPSASVSDVQDFIQRMAATERGRAFLQDAEADRILRALARYARTQPPLPGARVLIPQQYYIDTLRALLDPRDASGDASQAYYPVIRL